jgi:signal transduction histidine kinase
MVILSGWRSLLPYALIPAVIVLTVCTWCTGAYGPLERGVYLGGIVLIGLVSLRQYLAIRETIFYNKELQRVQQELRVKNQALSEANTQLETQATQIAAAYEQQLHLNELKDQFLLNVNHELRTPLTAIHGYLELLQEYQGQLDAARQVSFIRLAVQGCEELQQLVNNVLDAIHGDFQGIAPQFEVFPVIAVVSEVIDLFEPQKRQDYQIIVEIPETLTVEADRQHTHQILLNLLSNAFKYSPKQTPVVVSAQISDFSTPEGQVCPQVCICVQDAGPGIPPSEIPLLFGKFVRLKRDIVGYVRGTGLGLYICKQLVEAMDGHIWVESSGIVGQGSRFCFTLPSVYHASEAEQSQGPTFLSEIVPPAATNLNEQEESDVMVIRPVGKDEVPSQEAPNRW